MNNIKNNIKKEFTIIPNALINDDNLSDRARFVFVYMASKPDDWTFYNNELSKSLKYAIVTLRKYVSELQKSGWITKERIRNNGLFSANMYTLNASPVKLPCDTFVNMIKNQHDKKSTSLKFNIIKNQVDKKYALNKKYNNKKEKLKKNNLTKGIKILK